jgi:hypothetical protein
MITPEQIKDNWDKFLSNIELYISEPRKQLLLEFYTKHEERFIMMPASHKSQYHNCFPGGYVDHVNRVVDASLKITGVWGALGAIDTYTTEELVFSAINHDLGKFGDEQNAAYIEQTDQWRRDKLNETYMFNDRLEYMTVPDRGLHLLISNGILPTKNETLAIKLHDGLYDEANKPYLITFNPETKPRTSLIYVVHQADLLAARVEFEMEWLPKLLGPKQEQPKESKKDNFKLNKNNSAVKQKALKTMANPALAELMKNI